MNELLDRLEQMGRTGGVALLAAAAAVTALGLGLVFAGTDGFTDFSAAIASDPPQWVERGLVGGGFLAFAVALAAGLMGTRLLTQRYYPSASEVFPPMSLDEVRVALETRTEDQCVCARCRILVPSAFSTGACPVCASAVEYHEVRNDEDMKIVLAAMA